MDLGAFFTSFLSDAYRRRVFEDDSVLEHSFPHDLKTVKPLGSYPFPSPLVSVFEYLKSSRNRTPSRCSTIMVHGPFGVSAREEHDQTDSWYQFSAKYGVDPGVLLSLHPHLLHTLEFFRRFCPLMHNPYCFPPTLTILYSAQTVASKLPECPTAHQMTSQCKTCIQDEGSTRWTNTTIFPGPKFLV